MLWNIDYSAWLSLFLYMMASSLSPGPNNMMLMASGANFGFRRTLPHILGIMFGFAILLLSVGFGLLKIFDTYPLLYDILKYTGIIYLLYLSYKIATTTTNLEKTSPQQTKKNIKPSKSGARPLRFFEAAAFQFINPKGVMMAISFFATYLPPHYNWQVVIFVLFVDALVTVLHCSLWVVMGASLSRFLRRGQRQKYFNWAMAILLVSSLVPVLIHH